MRKYLWVQLVTVALLLAEYKALEISSGREDQAESAAESQETTDVTLRKPGVHGTGQTVYVPGIGTTPNDHGTAPVHIGGAGKPVYSPGTIGEPSNVNPPGEGPGTSQTVNVPATGNTPTATGQTGIGQDGKGQGTSQTGQSGQAGNGQGASQTGQAGKGQGASQSGQAGKGQGTGQTGQAGKGQGASQTGQAGKGQGASQTGQAGKGQGASQTGQAGKGQGASQTGQAGKGQGQVTGQTGQSGAGQTNMPPPKKCVTPTPTGPPPPTSDSNFASCGPFNTSPADTLAINVTGESCLSVGKQCQPGQVCCSGRCKANGATCRCTESRKQERCNDYNDCPANSCNPPAIPRRGCVPTCGNDGARVRRCNCRSNPSVKGNDPCAPCVEQ